MRRRTFLEVGIGLTLGPLWPAQAQEADDLVKKVERGLADENGPASIQDRMAFHKVPGVGVAVVRRGSIAWAKGYGLLEAGGNDQVTAQTIFQAASISKPVTAMAAMRLVQEGKLSLDDDINLRLRSWKLPESNASNAKAATLRMLLSHSAGLNVHGFAGYARGKARPTLVQILNGNPPANSQPIRIKSEPGTNFQYSGGGFCIVQQLIEDVTGMSFPNAVRALVLDPIEMRSSTFAQPIPDAIATSAARGHTSSGSLMAGRWHTYPEMAAAGLWTTPSDLVRFAIELSSSAAGNSERVLTAKTARIMLTPLQVGFGLGIGVKGDPPTFQHGGSNVGYRCHMVFHTKSGDGAVVMTNGERGGRILEEIIKKIATVYSWPS